MSEINHLSIQQYLDDLASQSATPGGGSASALMGAQGAALVSMVCRLTIGKPQYVEIEAEIQALLATAEQLRGQLTRLAAADIAVFNRLMAAYALPKTSDAEKTARSTEIQAVLQEATDVPMACARSCREVMAASAIAAEKGYGGAVSDAGAAVLSAYSGLKSAALNVWINTATLKDRAFAEAKTSELASLLDGADDLMAHVFAVVKGRL